LCCTNLHLLGPLTRPEVKRLRVLSPHIVAHNDALDADVLLTTEKGPCVFFDEGCALHRTLGAKGKPGGCRRFPFRLISTPIGGRVVTEHRCPCRTMGERPPVSMEEAEESLQDEGGRVRRDQRVGDRVKRTPKTTTPFASYAREEARWIARILAGEPVPDVLDAEPLPKMSEATWSDVAHDYRSRIDGTACGDAQAWFGDVLLEMTGTTIRSVRNRPWSPAFDRAEKRTPKKGDAEEILSDWAADAVWGMEWAQSQASVQTGCADVVTRWTIARKIMEKLKKVGTRSDRAAAEAVTIVEIAGASGVWSSVLRAIDRTARGRQRTG
jgi:hypothetical protein